MSARPRTAQELIHWLETGGGARWVLLGALLFCGLALSSVVAWMQFHGAASEATLAQADMAPPDRTGRGIHDRRSIIRRRWRFFGRGGSASTRPSLSRGLPGPLYPMVIAAPLCGPRPHPVRKALFAPAPAPPYGYAADYFLLALNLLLFWLAIWLAFDLARRLFGAPAGWLAALALFVSLPAWQQVVAVNGTALMMVLVARGIPRVVAGGVGGGPAAALAPALAPWAPSAAPSSSPSIPRAPSSPSRRGASARRFGAGAAVARARLVLAGGFALVAGPWVARNLGGHGSPRSGSRSRTSPSRPATRPPSPPSSGRRSRRSCPDRAEQARATRRSPRSRRRLRSRVWSGGAMWLLAFFAAGWLYVFRSGPVNRLRWLFAASLLVLVASQAVFNSGDSERQAVVWLCPAHHRLRRRVSSSSCSAATRCSASWPRACAAALLILQALPLAHDALDPHWLHFQYPPYFPQLFQGMRRQLDASDAGGTLRPHGGRAGGPRVVRRTRAWAQPATLHDFYEVQVEQPTGELLLTPKTLDRPFFSDLNAQRQGPGLPDGRGSPDRRVGRGLRGPPHRARFPREFPAFGPTEAGREPVRSRQSRSLSGGRARWSQSFPKN